jgi:hypothetical protein
MAEEKYRAAMTAVPTMDGAQVVWGWRAELEDLSRETKESFEFPSMFATSKEALAAGTKSLRALVRAYDEVAVYQVDLYAPEPEPEPEEPKEENPEEENEAPEGEPENENPEPERAAVE